MNHTAPTYRVERWAQTAGWVFVGDFSTPETARAACPDRSFRVTPLSASGEAILGYKLPGTAILAYNERLIFYITETQD